MQNEISLAQNEISFAGGGEGGHPDSRRPQSSRPTQATLTLFSRVLQARRYGVPWCYPRPLLPARAGWGLEHVQGSGQAASQPASRSILSRGPRTTRESANSCPLEIHGVSWPRPPPAARQGFQTALGKHQTAQCRGGACALRQRRTPCCRGLVV